MDVGTYWGRGWWTEHPSLHSHHLLQEPMLWGAFGGPAGPGREGRKSSLLGQPLGPAWGAVPSCCESQAGALTPRDQPLALAGAASVASLPSQVSAPSSLTGTLLPAS